MVGTGPVSRSEAVAQLRALGVAAGGVLLVHTSFRAVRSIEGGPIGLIDALRTAIGPEGTLVMPSWGGDEQTLFDSATTPVAEDLGVTAEVFRRLPGVLRSNHAEAFAALGPRASDITADPLPLPPHIPESPVGRVHDLDGQVLLLGVGHEANTTLHLAELLGGVPYRTPSTVLILRDGVPTRLTYGENDHCCQRFSQMDAWLRGRALQAEGLVGHAHTRLVRSRDVVSVALEHLLEDLLVFLHPPEAGCPDCDAARASIG